MKYCFLGFLALLFISCKGNKQQLAALLKEWEQKEIIFPSHTVFTIQGKDTVDFCKRPIQSFGIYRFYWMYWM